MLAPPERKAVSPSLFKTSEQDTGGAFPVRPEQKIKKTKPVRPAQLKLGGSLSDRGSDQGKARLALAMVAFTLVYGLIAGRLVQLGMTPDRPSVAYRTAQDSVSAARPDVTDRNGLILATDLKTFSLYAEPRRILDVNEVIISLMSVITDLRVESIRRKLESGAGFVWIKREITPEQRDAVHDLGIPGIGFLTEKPSLLSRRADRQPCHRACGCRQPGHCRT